MADNSQSDGADPLREASTHGDIQEADWQREREWAQVHRRACPLRRRYHTPALHRCPLLQCGVPQFTVRNFSVQVFMQLLSTRTFSFHGQIHSGTAK